MQDRVAELEAELSRLRRVEQAYLAQTELLNNLVGHLPAGLAYYDQDMVIRVANQAYCDLVGLPPEFVIGRSASELLPLVAPAVLELIRGVFNSGLANHSFGLPVRFERDGVITEGYRDAYRLPVKDPSGKVAGVLVMLQDVSVQVQLERALARERALLDRIVQNVPAGIAYLDRDFVFRWVNPEYARTVGLPPGAFINRSVYDILSDVRPNPRLQAVLETRAPHYEQAMAAKLGERLTYWDAAYLPIFGDDGEIEGIMAFSQEVSQRVERDRLQQERIHDLERYDRYKDEFLSVISHELRTPLNFIMGFASVLEDEVDGPLNPIQQTRVAKILAGADRMLALVDDLLDVAKLRSGRFELLKAPTAYAGLVREVAGLMAGLADARGLALELAVPDDLAAVMDGPRISQVLANLVSNAIKFTEPGGVVAVLAERDGDRLVTEVRDTGTGIAEADLKTVFEPFRQVDMSLTRRAGGTGLGLAIAKAIVEAHGGGIEALSVPGIGSTFRFWLPVAP